MTDCLTIAVDFDDTFTADPVLWSKFVQHAKQLGHNPIVVTARRNTAENMDLINEQLSHFDCHMRIYFSNLGSKVECMEKRGINVDIWIDDAPYALVHGR